MKSNIDLSEIDSCNATLSLLELLGRINICTADELFNDINLEYFCGYCEKHHDRCNCGDDDTRYRAHFYEDDDDFEL